MAACSKAPDSPVEAPGMSKVKLQNLSGEPVAADLSAVSKIEDIRASIAVANEVLPSNVRLLIGTAELDGSRLIDELRGSSDELVLQVVIAPASAVEEQLKKRLSKRFSTKTWEEMTSRTKLNCPYVRADTMQDMAAVYENPELASQMDTLPEGIIEISGLEELDMSNHCINHLPKAIGQLSQLKVLRLSNNTISKLPESIGSLVELQRLDLNKNKLKALPESFGSLVRLEQLDLRQNALSSLPETFPNLAELTELRLDGNKLQCFPEAFADLSNLVSLSVRSNPLQTLPEGFEQLKLDSFCFDISEVDEQLRPEFVRCLPESCQNLPAVLPYREKPERSSACSCLCRRRAKKGDVETADAEGTARISTMTTASTKTTASQDAILRKGTENARRKKDAQEPSHDLSMVFSSETERELSAKQREAVRNASVNSQLFSDDPSSFSAPNGATPQRASAVATSGADVPAPRTVKITV